MNTIKITHNEKTHTISAADDSKKRVALALNDVMGGSFGKFEVELFSVRNIPTVSDGQLENIVEFCNNNGWVIEIVAQKIEQPEPARDRQATDRQIDYLHYLNVDIGNYGDRLTVKFASQLIDAAKNDNLGNIMGAFYTDGSN